MGPKFEPLGEVHRADGTGTVNHLYLVALRDRWHACGFHGRTCTPGPSNIDIVPRRPSVNIAPNLLQQDIAASGPNQNRAGDITYVWTRESWVYLAVTLDLFSWRVVGWAVSNRMKQDLSLRTLNMAVAIRRPPPGCVHHTDRGSQYGAHDHQKLLRNTGSRGR